jgi:hypothetical protein
VRPKLSKACCSTHEVRVATCKCCRLECKYELEARRSSIGRRDRAGLRLMTLGSLFGNVSSIAPRLRLYVGRLCLIAVVALMCICAAFRNATSTADWISWRSAAVTVEGVVQEQIVFDALIDGKPTPLLFDTGATCTAIVRRSANTLERSHSWQIIGNPRPMHVSVGACRSVVEVFPMVFASSKPHIEQGLLGLDMFDGTSGKPGMRLTIDGANRRCKVDWQEDRPAYIPRTGSIAMPIGNVSANRHMIQVKASIDGGPLRPFIVDTGSPYEIWLAKPFPEMKDYRSRPKWIPDPRPVRLSLGQHVIDATSWSIYSKSPSLIGLPLLLRYRTTIDFRDKVLYLELLD